MHSIAKRSKLNIYQKLVLIGSKYFVIMNKGVNTLQLTSLVKMAQNPPSCRVNYRAQLQTTGNGNNVHVKLFSGQDLRDFLSCLIYFVKLAFFFPLNSNSQLWEREFVYKASPLMATNTTLFANFRDSWLSNGHCHLTKLYFVHRPVIDPRVFVSNKWQQSNINSY